MSARDLINAGAASSAAPTYVEDVFSTYLYTGNGSTQTITNGIDLSTKGGLVWRKARAGTYSQDDHILIDTARGRSNCLATNSINSQFSSASRELTSFNSNGFTMPPGDTNGYPLNTPGTTYASWTFRKQPKFFDVVTYTGDGSANRTIAHSLGSTPGFIVIKRTSATGFWYCWHRNYTGAGLYLNSSNIFPGDSPGFDASQSSTTINLINGGTLLNISGSTYVAYLFAHDAGGFGISGTDNVISCGSYTGNGSTTGPTVTLGYEPQWLLVKNASVAGHFWHMVDNMRGWTAGNTEATLLANTADAENGLTGAADYTRPTATGFQVDSPSGEVNTSGATYIYIAIRRGPMRTPTTGTSVFSPKGAIPLTTGQEVTTGFVTDMSIAKWNGDQEWLLSDRLRNAVLYPNTASSQGGLYGTAGPRPFDVQDGFKTSGISSSYFLWGFRRAPGFFDVVCYTGDGTSGKAYSHNLAVIPELMIVKGRSNTSNWKVLYQPHMQVLTLNTSDGYEPAANTKFYFGNDVINISPTASQFTVTNGGSLNLSNATYVAYLFASVPGVSKVGSYTGNGSSQTINCGFTTGARFVLIKRTNSLGDDWLVWDSARGIVAGNDPHLSLNTTAAEVTSNDSVDPVSTGFVVNQVDATNINVGSNNATYIYLAIA